MAAALPGLPIVFGILPGTVFCYFNVLIRPADQRNGGRGPPIHMAAAAGEVKHFVLGHLAKKHPFASFIFQLKLNRRNKVIIRRVLCMCATHVLIELL